MIGGDSLIKHLELFKIKACIVSVRDKDYLLAQDEDGVSYIYARITCEEVTPNNFCYYLNDGFTANTNSSITSILASSYYKTGFDYLYAESFQGAKNKLFNTLATCSSEEAAQETIEAQNRKHEYITERNIAYVRDMKKIYDMAIALVDKEFLSGSTRIALKVMGAISKKNKVDLNTLGACATIATTILYLNDNDYYTSDFVESDACIVGLRQYTYEHYGESDVVRLPVENMLRGMKGKTASEREAYGQSFVKSLNKRGRE